jgi:prevent-host-death family protein
MKRSELSIADDIVPVTDLKANAATWIEALAERDSPIVVTQHGRAAAVLLSPRAYDALTSRARFVAAVDEGLRQSEEGPTYSHAEILREIATRYRTSKPRKAEPRKAELRKKKTP